MAERHRETREQTLRRAKRREAAAAVADGAARDRANAAASGDEGDLRARAAKARRRLQEATDRRVKAHETELQHDRWVAGSVFEGTTAKLKQAKTAMRAAGRERQQKLAAERAATEAELKRVRFPELAGEAGDEPVASTEEADAATPWAAADAGIARAEAVRTRLQKLVLPELFVGPGPWGAAAVLAAVGAVGGAVAATGRGALLPAGLVAIAEGQGLDADLAAQITGGVLGAAVALALTLLLGWPLRRAARTKVAALAAEAASARAAASAGLEAGGQAVMARLKAESVAAREARDAAFAETRDEHQPPIERLRAANQKRLEGLAAAVRERKEGSGTAAGRRAAAIAAAAEAAAAARAARVQKRERVTDARRDRDAERAAGSADRRRKEVREATVRGLAAVLDPLDRLRDAAAAACPPWADAAWNEWSPPAASPGPVRLGRHAVDRAELLAGLAWPDGLPALPETLEVPAVLGPVGSPSPRSLRVTAPAAQRSEAVGVLRGAVLRWLTTQPPGRVRLTLIDPVGLGESFAALMHLADADPRLVGGKIWSEPRDIDQQLAQLSEHVGTVIQDRLRNEHADLEDFNRHAGPLAEPYRLLVVADFPHGFGPEAAQRLENLAAAGPRCGVFLALSRDADEPLPAGCEGLAEGSVRDLSLAGSPTLDGRAVALEEPPTPTLATTLVRAVGEASKKADRVAVSFSEIAPKPEERWSRDASDSIAIPMGRSARPASRSSAWARASPSTRSSPAKPARAKARCCTCSRRTCACGTRPRRWSCTWSTSRRASSSSRTRRPGCRTPARWRWRATGLSGWRCSRSSTSRWTSAAGCSVRRGSRGSRRSAGRRRWPDTPPASQDRPACRGRCSSSTSSRSCSRPKTASPRTPRPCSTGSSARAGPSACTRSSGVNPSPEPPSWPAARWARWRCGSRSAATRRTAS